MIMTWSPTRTVPESAIRAGVMAWGTRSIWRSERSAAGSEATILAGTRSPPRASTVISSIALTTCAAVITLPSAVISTPEPVSLKRVMPTLLTSRPLARITTTEGLALRKTSLRFWDWAGAASATSADPASAAAKNRFTALGRPVVRELQRDAEVLRLHEGDDGLKVVAVLAGYAHMLLLDRGLNPDLRILDEAHDLLGLLHGDTVLERDALTQGAAGRRLGVLDRERLEVDAAAVELGLKDVEHGFELHVVGRGQDEVHLLLDDLVLRALQIVTRLHFPPGLVDGVGDLLHVHLARDVEAVLRGQNGSYLMSSGTTAVPLGGANAKRVSLRPGLRTTRLNVIVTVFCSWS